MQALEVFADAFLEGEVQRKVDEVDDNWEGEEAERRAMAQVSIDSHP